MSIYDKRRKELGLDSSNTSFYEKRRIELGMMKEPYQIETERQKTNNYSNLLPVINNKLLESKRPIIPKIEPKPIEREAITPQVRPKPAGGYLGLGDIPKPVTSKVEPKRGALESFGSTLGDVSQFLSSIQSGLLDTATFGATSALDEAISRILPGEFGATPEQKESIPYKAGEFAGYLYPGVLIERGISTVAKPLIRKLPSMAESAIKPIAARLSPQAGALTRIGAQTVGKGAGMAGRGATVGALEMLGQEAGDVAFRGETFDPKNIALGAAIGGVLDPALTVGIPAAIKGGKKALEKRALDKEIKKFIKRTEQDIPFDPLQNKPIQNIPTRSVKDSLPQSVAIQSNNDISPLNVLRNKPDVQMPKIAPRENVRLDPLANRTETMAGNTPSKISNQTGDILSNSGDWKNKSTIALKRETMERNFDDIMGKDAPAMKKQYLEPIKDSEATRTHFLNANRDEVRALDIKYKSKEDKLVQMYGEKKISLDELKNQTKDWQKVVKATETMRNKYDDLFNTLNKALVDNGYDPVPKRKDYFPHYEEIDTMFSKLGFDIKNFELPTEIIGRTQNFKPGKNFFGNILQRKGEKTTYGFIEGFDRYIEGASRVIHHTKNIKKLRKLENDIRAQHGDSTHLGSFVADLQDYTNNLSGKQSAVDRGLESAVGRGIYNFMDTTRRRVSLNMIGANLGSAMTNFIPVTHSLATNNKKAFAEGLYDAAANIFKNDGFVKESDFLTRRYGSDRLAQTKVDKVIDKSMIFMRGFDRFASNIIVRSKFKEGLAKGLPRKEAMEKADDWAAKMMADRSLGQMPTYFNSKSLGPLIQFQLEVNNQLSFLLKDIPRSMNKKKTASALAQVAVYAYLYNEAFEKVTGRRVALDPIGLVVKAFEDFTNPEISKGRASANTVKGITDQLPFTSTFTGGRIPMSAALPNPKTVLDSDFNMKTIGNELLKPAFYLFPPTAGGQVKKTIEGLTAMNKNPLFPQEMPGLYQENPKGEKYLKYPIKNSLSNNLKASIFGKYSTPETEEYYGNKRRPLSPLQTKKLERAESSGRDTNKLYNNMQIDRRIGTLETKIKDTRRDKRLTLQEKQREVEKLRKLIKELRESRVR